MDPWVVQFSVHQWVINGPINNTNIYQSVIQWVVQSFNYQSIDDWAIDWLIEWLLYRYTDLLICWLGGGLLPRTVDLFFLPTISLIRWFADSFIRRFLGGGVGSLVGSISDTMIAGYPGQPIKSFSGDLRMVSRDSSDVRRIHSRITDRAPVMRQEVTEPIN